MLHVVIYALAILLFFLAGGASSRPRYNPSAGDTSEGSIDTDLDYLNLKQGDSPSSDEDEFFDAEDGKETKKSIVFV